MYKGILEVEWQRDGASKLKGCFREGLSGGHSLVMVRTVGKSAGLVEWSRWRSSRVRK